jgi:predicted DNA-binding transcriptional regulator AlpA
MSTSPFLLPDEVEQISRLCDLTRMRQEKRGRFPKRVKLAKRKIGYRRTDIEDWSRDPETWVQRHQQPNESPIEPERVSG